MTEFKPHHVHLMSQQAMDTGRYYEKMFGATIAESVGANGLPRCNVNLQGQRILISTVGPEIDQISSGPHGRLGLDHIGLRVDDIHTAADELKSKGAEFLMEPRVNKNVGIAFVKAPDGVFVELVAYES